MVAVVAGCVKSAGALPDDLTAALRAKGPDYKPRTHHLRPDGSPSYTNRLILESSPYLLQHAHNPVNWNAWSDAAFARARVEGKLVLMSIGYSTCHWCHVMERESFEDLEIAAYLNDHYVAIKVDREERPDLDSIYMSAVTLLTGRGGWPMTTILTPDRKPVFGGTYFPARDGDRGGGKGFLSILREVHEAWVKDPKALEARAQELSRRIAADTQPEASAGLPDSKAIEVAVAALARAFDPTWGGFGGAPKFPRPAVFELLAHHYRRSRDPQMLAMIETTLQKMAAGGMHDQVGGGFHRYSTDRQWLVPHFEKMLYDNAQLVLAYLDAYQLTENPSYAQVAERTLEYALREMRELRELALGFYSATDADSPAPSGHDEEGLFFTWTEKELDALLSAAEAQAVIRYYAMTPGGNFEGRSILHTPRSLDVVAKELGVGADELQRRITAAQGKLYAARKLRAAPITDTKVLLSWNALMISALARAALVLDKPHFASAAVETSEFILRKMREGERLLRIYKDGVAKQPAFLEDYAFLVAAFLDLHETTQQQRWLDAALVLHHLETQLFWDEAHGGYFVTSKDAEELLTREKDSYDGAIPAANSVCAQNLLRLWQLTSDDAYRARAARTLSAFSASLTQAGHASPKMLAALDFYLDEPLQIILVADERAQLKPLLDVARRTYVPNRVLFTVTTEEARTQSDAVALLRDKVPLHGQPTAYVCRKQVCELPTHEPAVLATQLGLVR